MRVEIKKVKQADFEICLDLFVTAFEGGSSYWAEVRESGNSESLFLKAWELGQGMPVYDVENPDELLGEVTRESMEVALQRVKDEYTHIDVRCADGGDADVWFQLATMNEVIFG